MNAFPPGTVTFLFTDIEGSSKLWEQHPEAMQSALEKHDQILRQAIETNYGMIVKTTGDGVHAVFESVVKGIGAALAAQQAMCAENWNGIHPQVIRVRMGLHTGEAELRDGDYYGSTLNRASRLMSAGHGGQVLVSQATAELVRDQLPEGAGLIALGEHRLKDLTRAEQIYQLAHPSLHSDFPPLRSLDSITNNLPVQVNSFIGRQAEIAGIKGLLETSRLVTLTGSGGTGKTRLSQEVSVQVMEIFPNGVWLVELAPLTEPTQVIPALARVFNLQEVSFTTLESLVTEYLRGKQALLILDNCEHLIATCARLADHLLHHCPRLKIIASSREALGIAGETAYRIPSLASPEAVQLFVERAQAANSAFRLNEANTPLVEEICRRLDGIPLAIELAAARIRALTPEQIAARLSDRFRLLVGGSRAALPRQQTLRAAIDWSYDLLAEEEKRLLRKASVFAGGWTLDALEAVSGSPDAWEDLEQLVNKSLVATEETGGQMRYFLLETVRQYAREKLLDSGADEVTRTRANHLKFFVELSEASIERLTGPDMIACLDELEREQDNLRSAVEWAIDHDPLSAMRLAAALLPTFWAQRLSAIEGYTWVRAALARSEPDLLEGEPALSALGIRAGACLGEAALAFALGNNSAAQESVEESVRLARLAGKTDTLAYALAMGSTICGFMGDISTAQSWAEESIALSRENKFMWTLASVIGAKAFLAAMTNTPIPPGAAEEMLQAARSSGNPWTQGMAYTNVARILMVSEKWSEAVPFLEDAVTLFQKIRNRSMVNMIRSELGHLSRHQGRYAEAAAFYRETIQTYRELSMQAAVAHELECFAMIAVEQNQCIRAAQLFGAAEALRERIHIDMIPPERLEYNRVVASLRGQMVEADLLKAWAEGRAMDMDSAIHCSVASDVEADISRV